MLLLLIGVVSQSSRGWVASPPLSSGAILGESRGVYRDLTLTLHPAAGEQQHTQNTTIFLNATETDKLFVVETNGPEQLTKVLQDPSLRIAGVYGLSVVVAAEVWPDVDVGLARDTVPVSIIKSDAGGHTKGIVLLLGCGVCNITGVLPT